MSHDTILTAFHAILERGGSPRTLTFAPADEEAFMLAYSRLGRFIEPDRPQITAGEAAVLAEAGVVEPSVWRPIDMARACMALSYLRLTRDERHPEVVQRLFREGELGERESLLRYLNLLPSPRRFLGTALEGHRVALQSVFEALACENSYPATHFSESAFNQMVVKALFLGVASERIWGLGERVNVELVRMTQAYASEREAAGRPIPQDIHFILHSISNGVH